MLSLVLDFLSPDVADDVEEDTVGLLQEANGINSAFNVRDTSMWEDEWGAAIDDEIINSKHFVVLWLVNT